MSSTIDVPATKNGALTTVDRLATRHMPQLDGLRAIAVLMVIWSHWASGYKTLFGIHLGFLGVQLFFVLSGFLISGILLDCSLQEQADRKRGFILKQFYIRRFLRIFPLYYLILGLAVFLNVPPFRTTWPWHAAYLSNVHYWILGSMEGYGTHIWSLSVEEQFYLCWPILLLFIPNRNRMWFILLLIFIAPLFRLTIGVMHWGKDPRMAPWLTPGTLDSLGVGALLAYAERFRPDLVSRLTNLLLGAGIVGYTFIHYSGKMTDWTQTTCAFCFCWIIWNASRGFSGWFGAFLESKPIGYLGRISYGVYVIHGFALAFWFWLLYSAPIPGYRIFARLHVPAQVYEGHAVTVMMMAVITISLAVLSFRFYETPINNLKRHFPYLKPNPQRQEVI
jgi:peptidoglycan/LPS O-acetylase OafA/YrhL